MTPKRLKTLVEAAAQARKLAYCPYSRYAVGAAVLTDDDRIYAGANVENASYGLSICAERVAVFNAVGHGARKLKAVCVASREGAPCGACRQVMIEFSDKNTALVLVNLRGASQRPTTRATKVFAMLPHAFNPKEAGLLN